MARSLRQLKAAGEAGPAAGEASPAAGQAGPAAVNTSSNEPAQ